MVLSDVSGFPPGSVAVVLIDLCSLIQWPAVRHAEAACVLLIYFVFLDDVTRFAWPSATAGASSGALSHPGLLSFHLLNVHAHPLRPLAWGLSLVTVPHPEG